MNQVVVSNALLSSEFVAFAFPPPTDSTLGGSANERILEAGVALSLHFFVFVATRPSPRIARFLVHCWGINRLRIRTQASQPPGSWSCGQACKSVRTVHTVCTLAVEISKTPSATLCGSVGSSAPPLGSVGAVGGGLPCARAHPRIACGHAEVGSLLIFA